MYNPHLECEQEQTSLSHSILGADSHTELKPYQSQHTVRVVKQQYIHTYNKSIENEVKTLKLKALKIKIYVSSTTGTRTNTTMMSEAITI
jgi:hypothetical protein